MPSFNRPKKDENRLGNPDRDCFFSFLLVTIPTLVFGLCLGWGFEWVLSGVVGVVCEGDGDGNGACDDEGLEPETVEYSAYVRWTVREIWKQIFKIVLV